jgi:hypothetical protein
MKKILIASTALVICLNSFASDRFTVSGGILEDQKNLLQLKLLYPAPIKPSELNESLKWSVAAPRDISNTLLSQDSVAFNYFQEQMRTSLSCDEGYSQCFGGLTSVGIGSRDDSSLRQQKILIIANYNIGSSGIIENLKISEVANPPWSDYCQLEVSCSNLPTFRVMSIPEPSSVILFSIGLLAALSMHRKKMKLPHKEITA